MEFVKGRPWKELGAYFLCIIVLTFPVIIDPINTVIGHEQATAACHVWIFWWAQQHLGEFQTDLIFYPFGSNVVLLYGSDFLSPLLFAPFPFPPSLAYNIWVAFLLICGAMGVRSLCLFLGASKGGAFVGGVFFCAAPFFQHEILNGTSEIVASAFLPWFTRYLFQMLQRATPKVAIILGVLAGVSVMASVYNAFFLLFISLCILIHRFCTSIQPVFTMAFWMHIFLSLFCFAPFLSCIVYLHYFHGSDATLRRREDWLDIGSQLPDSFADLLDFFDPRAAEIPVLIQQPNNMVFSYWTTCTVYLGWIGIGVLCYGWWKKKEHFKARGAMLLLFFFSILIAMGPYLQVGGEAVLISDSPVALPLYTIAYLFPVISLSALHAYRYTAIAVLALSSIVGCTLRHPLWALAILLETILISPIPYPAPVTKMPASPALEQLRKEPYGAVFVAPLIKENLHDIGLALTSQIYHHKPIQDGGIHRRAAKESTRLFEENVLVNELSTRSKWTFIEDHVAIQAAIELYLYGFHYILVPAEAEKVQEWISSWLGAPVRDDGHWAYWRLEVLEEIKEPPEEEPE